jgi:sugar O-acyltransferase (sialic acid O-acetyltransferase NeuD family)
MITENRVFLLGMSGHALSVIDALNSMEIQPTGYFDQINYGSDHLPYCGNETNEEAIKSLTEFDMLFPAVGDNHLRKRLIEWIISIGGKQTIVQHRAAIVSQTAQIGDSSFISAGSIVHSHVNIGRGVIVNSGAIVEHECLVNDFVHIAPGAVLAGNVQVGQSSFVGANATVKQGVSIGRNVIIGAGSVVLKNVPDNTIYVGNPAQFLRKNE